MFTTHIPPAFERDYGCTEADWLRWLPDAVRDCPLALAAAGHAEVLIAGGLLRLQWAELPPRQIALMRMPRLAVQFAFDGVNEEARADFMRYFDLVLQRGGG